MFRTSGIKFKHGLIENAMFRWGFEISKLDWLRAIPNQDDPIRIILKTRISGVQWIDHDQIGLSAYGRDYVITEKIG